MTEAIDIPTRDSAAAPRDHAHEAGDFMWAAWRTIDETPELVVWRVVGDMVGFLLRPAALFWVFGVLAAGIGMGTRGGATPWEVVAGADPYKLVGGLVGFVALFWLTGIVVDSVVDGGILETFARPLRDSGETATGVFGNAGTGFLRYAGLRLIGAVVQATLTLLGLTLAVAALRTFALMTAGLTSSILLRSLLLAVPAFLYVTLALLVRLTLRVAAAPLFVDERSVGDALYDGAAFVLDRFAGLYRIVVAVAGLLVAPLFIYLGFLLVANLWGFGGPLGPFLEAVRLVGQIAILTAFGVAALLFDGAVLTYYAHCRGRIAIPASGESDAQQSEPGSPYDGSTRLDDLLPESFDAITRIEDDSS